MGFGVALWASPDVLRSRLWMGFGVGCEVVAMRMGPPLPSR
jgi:hypothetical protein